MRLEFRISTAALAIVGAAHLLATPAAAAGSDAFNRPKLGGAWVKVAGKISISSDHFAGTDSAIGYLKASSKDTAASAVFSLGSTDLEYGAIALGDVPGGGNAFVKLQSQDGGGMFDHGGFYTGNNVAVNFFTLSTPVPSPATVDVFFCGTVAEMRITSTAGVSTYTYDYGSGFSSGGGLGTFGSIAIDNYIGFQSSCSDTPAAHRAIDMRHAVDKSLAK